MKISIIILCLFLVGCATQKTYSRVTDFFPRGQTFTEVGEELNQEFDNIYKILNKTRSR